MFSGLTRRVGVVFVFCAAAAMLPTLALALDRISPQTLAHFISGCVYDRLGQDDRALEEYRAACARDNKSILLHIKLASAYIKKNEIHKALREAAVAAKIDPAAVEPRAISALIYYSQGKVDLASREYEAALKNASRLEPGNIEFYRSLVGVYLRQRKLKEAQETCRIILGLSPKDAEAHFYLANIYEELKDPGRTEEELKKALELKPDYPEALNYLGYLYADQGKNLAQAEKMLKKALELDPENGAYLDSLGWVYFKEGNLKEAAVNLEKAASLYEDPAIYDHLGELYLKNGESVKAQESWKRSLELDPGQEKVKAKLEKLNTGNQ